MQYIPLLYVVISGVLLLITSSAVIRTLYTFISVEQLQEGVLLIDEKVIEQASELLQQNTILD